LAAEAWLRAEGLTKAYGGVLALGDASVAVRAGEIRGLVGANGAGKSTLVKILTGIVRPTAGRVLVSGRELPPGRPREALRAGIASVPQELTLAPALTVAENVMLGHEPAARPGFVRSRDLRRRARGVLDSLSLDLPLDELAGRLTLVEQRLVMIARALSFDARLVIFDEPTATVSPREVDLLHDVVRRLAAAGVAALYVSHHLREIEELCDSATVLRDGRVVAELTPPSHAALVAELAPEAEADRAPQRVAAPGEPVLVARAVSGERLHGIDLEARAGEIVGLAGLAGSGARELLLTVAGAVPWQTGELELCGRPLHPGSCVRSVAAGAGFLPGNRALAAFPSHSVRHNVTLPSLRGAFVRRGEERSAVAALLDRVALRAGTETQMSELSGGNQQKALVARWIASGARLLLLDDPTAGVDVATRPELHARIVAVAEAGAAVLLVSTDVDELVALADRVLVFERGAITDELSGARLAPAPLLTAMTRTIRPEGADP
jgi:ABC-type sugar transport system ATPase subunit